MGDPHLSVTVPGLPAYTYDCQTPGWVNTLNSTKYGLVVQVQQRHLITGQDVSGNSGLDVTSPLTTPFFLLNGIFTIGSIQYTRTTLMDALSINPYFATGLKITQSLSSQGDIVVDLLPYTTRLQFNFWNFDDSGGGGTGTFFNLYVVYPDTVLADTGMCIYTTGVCPPFAQQNPLDYSTPSFFRSSRVLTTVTDAEVNAACGALQAVSSFFYAACRYDVVGSNNPNFANIVITNLNNVITILSQQGALTASSNPLINTTALVISAGGVIAAIPSVPVNTNYPTISTNDIHSAGSSSSSTGINAAPAQQPSLIVFASLALFVSMVLNRINS